MNDDAVAREREYDRYACQSSLPFLVGDRVIESV